MADTSGFVLDENILVPVRDALRAAPAYAEIIVAGVAQRVEITDRSVSGDGSASVGFTIPQTGSTYIVSGIRLRGEGGELLGSRDLSITMEPGDTGLFYRVRMKPEIINPLA